MLRILTAGQQDSDADAGQAEEDYLEQVLFRLRTNRGSLLIGSLPKYPEALKRKYGKASRFIASRPDVFEFSPPWVSLKNDAAPRHSSAHKRTSDHMDEEQEDDDDGNSSGHRVVVEHLPQV